MGKKDARKKLRSAEEACMETMVRRREACGRVYGPTNVEESRGGGMEQKDAELIAVCHEAMRREKQCIGTRLCPSQARRYYSDMCDPDALAREETSATVRRMCRSYAYDLTACMHSYFRSVKDRNQLHSAFRSDEEQQQAMPYEYTEADEKVLQKAE